LSSVKTPASGLETLIPMIMNDIKLLFENYIKSQTQDQTPPKIPLHKRIHSKYSVVIRCDYCGSDMGYNCVNSNAPTGNLCMDCLGKVTPNVENENKPESEYNLNLTDYERQKFERLLK